MRWSLGCSALQYDQKGQVGGLPIDELCGVSVCSERYFACFFFFALVATKLKFRPHPRCAIATLAQSLMTAMVEVDAEAGAELEAQAEAAA
jgi:hypothetical protein